MGFEFVSYVSGKTGAAPRRAILFGGLGLFAAITYFCVFTGLNWICASLIVANAGAFLVANAQSYCLNSAITFRRNGAAAPRSLKGYAKFLAAHVAGLIASTILILALADAIGAMAAKILSIFVAYVFNYALSATFVFKAD